MQYAKIEQGAVVAFPYTLWQFQADFPNVSVDWTAADDLAEFGVVVPAEDPMPVMEPGEFATLGNPEMVEGVCLRRQIVTPVTSERLLAHEADLHRQIDASAGEFRRQFITDVPGQAETYVEKAAEAAAYAIDPNGAYPFLAAEAAALGVPLADVADEVAATAAAWRALAAAIEGRRRGAKKAVTEARIAGDWAAMNAASAIIWQDLLP